METDFTKFMMEAVEKEGTLFYHNFCLLDENPFKVSVFDSIFPLDCLHEAKVYSTNVEEAIKWSFEYTPEKSVKILDYLYDKLDHYMDLYCERFGVDPNYEPDQNLIEKYMQNPYVEDFDEDLFIRLQEEAYDKAREKYQEQHAKELEGIYILEKDKFEIEKHLYYQKCKNEFVNKALKSKRKERPNIYDFIPDINEDKDLIVSIMKKHLSNKKGQSVALLVIIWQIEKYLYIPEGKKATFYDSVRECFGYDIGSNQSINNYLTESIGELKKRRKYANWSDEEIEQNRAIYRS